MSPDGEQSGLRIGVDEGLNAALIILLLEKRSKQGLGLRVLYLERFFIGTLVTVVSPSARQLLHKIIFPETPGYQSLADELLN